jgi:phosphate transport system ATP-binding protein
MNDHRSAHHRRGSLDGVDIFGPGVVLTELRKKVGMVFQRPNPFPLSIFDNVVYGPRLHGQPRKAELQETLERSLTAVEMWGEVKDRLKTPALSLTEEQQQRLCIARVLAVEPEILLMDEPCSALDPIATLRIEELMQELKRNYTIIIVTHNMHRRPGPRTSRLHALGNIEIGPGGYLHLAQGLPLRTTQGKYGW